MSTSHSQPDLEAIKATQQATWASGDYAVIGTTLQIVGESLCEAMDLSAGSEVLDVAAGNGNVSLAAARRGARVTASDYVAGLLEVAARRAEAEGLAVFGRVADAENLPFNDRTFDAVVSTFGVMFVPNSERAAAEMLRVTRPGGRIGLTSWTPTGFIGQMFKVVGDHLPPPAGIRSPLEWGTEARLAELFPGASIEARPQHFVFRYRSAQDWVDTFRTYYGPTLKAFAALDEVQRKQLETDLLDLAADHDVATDGTLKVPSEYLEVVVTPA